MTTFLTTAISLNMLERKSYRLETAPIDLQRAKSLLSVDYVNAVGHESTAAILSNMLGMDIKRSRVNVVAKDGDVAVVAQYHGPRLPEGATTLPDGASIEFWEVRFYVVI